MDQNPFDPFGKMKFDVEHALSIYASSFATFPAFSLYDKEFLKQLKINERSFHIYLVGYLPKITENNIREEDGQLCIPTSFSKREFTLKWPIPSGWKFVQNGDDVCLKDEIGEKRWIDNETRMRELNFAAGGYPFTVKYIGQAYGDDGSRGAIDRLFKHETLQKIAVKGVPDDVVLQVLLLEIETSNQIFTMFFPNADNKDEDGARRRQGLDKLFDTSDAERVSLYEAALIRHFSPEFNKEFKYSFPSTNLKVLNECYKKDFLGLVSEICFDGAMPFYLGSDNVKPKLNHIIRHDLQNDKQRRMFFSAEF